MEGAGLTVLMFESTSQTDQVIVSTSDYFPSLSFPAGLGQSLPADPLPNRTYFADVPFGQLLFVRLNSSKCYFPGRCTAK